MSGPVNETPSATVASSRAAPVNEVIASFSEAERATVASRADELYRSRRLISARSTDRAFAVLFAIQWPVAILVALVVSPRTWIAESSYLHLHVKAAVLLGGLISAFPIWLAIRHPGAVVTRHVIAVSQALMGALLIHLSGGRIETHFHVFGSLAFLAFYLDWRVLLSASAVVAVDHFVRGIWFPQSVFGVVAASEWRWLEHAGWVVFEDIFLLLSCRRELIQHRGLAEREAGLELAHGKNVAQLEQLRATNTEITAQRRRLEQLNADLQEAAKAKSEFLASMSHELRTPLNAIIGYTSLTLRQLSGSKAELGDEVLGDLRRSERAARTLLRLINDVLDFSRIEAGRMEIFPEPIFVEDSIEVCASTVKGLLLEKSAVTLELDLEDELPEIETDPLRLEQILTNLLGNAVKFTEAGTITVKAKAHGDGVQLRVRDTGCGIPQERLASIFESFRQIDGSMRKKVGGTGLGLAITWRLCGLLGIAIEVSSEVGEGTEFVLTIPSAVPAETDDSPVGERSSTAAASTTRARDSGETAEPPDTPTSAATPPAGEHRGAAPARADFAAGVEVMVQPESPARVACLVRNPETCGLIEGELADSPLTVEHFNSLDQAVAANTNPEDLWAVIVDGDAAGLELMHTLRGHESFRGMPILICGDGHPERDLGLLKVDVLPPRPDKDELLSAMVRAGRLRRGRILIIEDDPDTLHLYRQLLSEEGYDVDTAEDGQVGLEKLRADPLPVLVVLDLFMPRLDGFGVLREISADESLRRVPVVVASGRPWPEDDEQLKRGVAKILDKGRLDSFELSRRVAEMVSELVLARGRTIIVVDDNAANLDLFRRLFRQDGYEVLAASSGEEAIALAVESRADVMLLDLAMPGMDGFDVMERLKTLEVVPDLTVVACSAFVGSDSRDRARGAGFAGYITKPIEPERLVHQVRSCLLASKVRSLSWPASSSSTTTPMSGVSSS